MILRKAHVNNSDYITATVSVQQFIDVGAYEVSALSLLFYHFQNT